MIRRVLLCSLLTAILAVCGPVYGQHGPYAGEMRKIASMVMGTKNISYNYMMSTEYPNGEKDAISGFAYTGGDDKFLYNDNNLFTMIYTNKWFYKADHKEKTVVVVNLQKNLSKDYKEQMEHDVFGGGKLSFYFDSVILKHATVKKLKKTGDTVNMDLTFSKQSPIKSIYFSYDDKEQLLIAYRLYAFQEWRTNEFGQGKGTAQTIACRGFKKGDRRKEYKTDDFFTIKNGGVVLKKFKAYKLNTKI